MFAKMDFSRGFMVLDLACGTGLVTFELSRALKRSGLVVGLDLSPAMLAIANKKKRRVQGGSNVDFVRAAGEFLPLRSDTLSYVTVGLALRNFGDKSAVFREALRVLNRSGWFLSLDFTRPETSVWRLYYFHIFHVLPPLGGLVSGYWKRTLIYLATTILKSATADETAQALLSAGFRRTLWEKMTLGVVALVCGQK